MINYLIDIVTNSYIFKYINTNIIMNININYSFIFKSLTIVPFLFCNLFLDNTYILYNSLTFTVNNIYLFLLYNNIDTIIKYINVNKNDLYKIFYLYITSKLFDLNYNRDYLQIIRILHIYLYTLYNIKYDVLDYILEIKITLKTYYENYFTNNNLNGFILNKVELYTNLTTNYDVTEYFEGINRINKKLITDIYKFKNLTFDENCDIRLKIYFTYDQHEYIMYFPYDILLNLNLNINDDNIEDNYYLPFPMYSDKIINDFKIDYILPYHMKEKTKKEFYSLFHIESKDILMISINDCHNMELMKYFNKIKTPFNDFGILYNVPIKLNWILSENNIDITTFNNLYFKFLSVYLCEIEFDLKEHIIKMNENDLDKIFISERMKQILLI